MGLTAGTSTLKETVMEVHEELEKISHGHHFNELEKLVC